MADTSLNENRLGLLIWQTSNLWQSKIKFLLRNSNISFNEYLILETLYKLQKNRNYITQQEICKNSSIDRSVAWLINQSIGRSTIDGSVHLCIHRSVDRLINGLMYQWIDGVIDGSTDGWWID